MLETEDYETHYEADDEADDEADNGAGAKGYTITAVVIVK